MNCLSDNYLNRLIENILEFSSKQKHKQHNSVNAQTQSTKNILINVFFFAATAQVRPKRQDDDSDEPNIEELCQDRPADEYFRLSADGDCRDVVRYNLHQLGQLFNFYYQTQLLQGKFGWNHLLYLAGPAPSTLKSRAQCKASLKEYLGNHFLLSLFIALFCLSPHNPLFVWQNSYIIKQLNI